MDAKGSVKIRQNNELYATVLGSGDTVKHALKKDRHAYVQVARGSVKLNGTKLEVGRWARLSPLKKSVELTGVEKCRSAAFSTWRVNDSEKVKVRGRGRPFRALFFCGGEFQPRGAMKFAHEAGEGLGRLSSVTAFVERDAQAADGAVAGRAGQPRRGRFRRELLLDGFVSSGHAGRPRSSSNASYFPRGSDIKTAAGFQGVIQELGFGVVAFFRLRRPRLRIQSTPKPAQRCRPRRSGGV